MNVYVFWNGIVCNGINKTAKELTGRITLT